MTDTALPPLPHCGVGALTDGEESILRAWAENYARAAIAQTAQQASTPSAAPTDIHSPFNACMYREHCRSLAAPAPQQAPLTDERIDKLWRDACKRPDPTRELVRSFVRDVLAAAGAAQTTKE